MHKNNLAPFGAKFTVLTEYDYPHTDEDVQLYASSLGIDAETEPELLWIAREGLVAHLPEGWEIIQDEYDQLFYYNPSTGRSSWEHPCDELFRRKVIRYRSVLHRPNNDGPSRHQEKLKEFIAKISDIKAEDWSVLDDGFTDTFTSEVKTSDDTEHPKIATSVALEIEQPSCEQMELPETPTEYKELVLSREVRRSNLSGIPSACESLNEAEGPHSSLFNVDPLTSNIPKNIKKSGNVDILTSSLMPNASDSLNSVAASPRAATVQISTHGTNLNPLISSPANEPSSSLANLDPYLSIAYLEKLQQTSSGLASLEAKLKCNLSVNPPSTTKLSPTSNASVIQNISSRSLDYRPIDSSNDVCPARVLTVPADSTTPDKTRQAQSTLFASASPPPNSPVHAGAVYLVSVSEREPLSDKEAARSNNSYECSNSAHLSPTPRVTGPRLGASPTALERPVATRALLENKFKPVPAQTNNNSIDILESGKSPEPAAGIQVDSSRASAARIAFTGFSLLSPAEIEHRASQNTTSIPLPKVSVGSPTDISTVPRTVLLDTRSLSPRLPDLTMPKSKQINNMDNSIHLRWTPIATVSVPLTVAESPEASESEQENLRPAAHRHLLESTRLNPLHSQEASFRVDRCVTSLLKPVSGRLPSAATQASSANVDSLGSDRPGSSKKELNPHLNAESSTKADLNNEFSRNCDVNLVSSQEKAIKTTSPHLSDVMEACLRNVDDAVLGPQISELRPIPDDRSGSRFVSEDTNSSVPSWSWQSTIHLMEERSRLERKILHLKVTYRTYKQRLANLDSVLSLLHSTSAPASGLSTGRFAPNPHSSISFANVASSSCHSTLPANTTARQVHQTGQHSHSRHLTCSPLMAPSQPRDSFLQNGNQSIKAFASDPLSFKFLKKPDGAPLVSCPQTSPIVSISHRSTSQPRNVLSYLDPERRVSYLPCTVPSDHPNKSRETESASLNSELNGACLSGQNLACDLIRGQPSLVNEPVTVTMEALGSSNGSCSLYDRHIPINRASSRLIEGAHKVLVGRRCISRNNQDDTATSTALQHMGDASDAHLDKLRACSSVDRMSNRLSQLSLSSTRPAVTRDSQVLRMHASPSRMVGFTGSRTSRDSIARRYSELGDAFGLRLPGDPANPVSDTGCYLFDQGDFDCSIVQGCALFDSTVPRPQDFHSVTDTSNSLLRLLPRLENSPTAHPTLC